MTYSYDDYIKNDDFEGAKIRFETTNKRWKQHWWNCLVSIYEKSKRWAKKYILDPINKIISENILLADEMIEDLAKEYDDSGNNCYLFKFFDFDDNIIFSKIGTSTRSIRKRLRKEINDYIKMGFDIWRATIESVIDCGKTHVHGAESAVRAKLIKKYPTNYLPNDRFLNLNVSVKEFNKIVKAYLG